MRDLADAVLDGAFRPLYSLAGRPSIPPEQVLRATLPQLLYTIRSERQLMERMQYDLLFRWFVGLGIDDPVFVPTVFTKNRDRILTTDIAQKFPAALLAQPQVAKLSGAEHFSIDGTMPEAFASIRSFRARDGADKPPDAGRNGERDFKREKLSNDTQASTTDPDARLYRKSSAQESKPAYPGHALMENRHGLAAGLQPCPPAEIARAKGGAVPGRREIEGNDEEYRQYPPICGPGRQKRPKIKFRPRNCRQANGFSAACQISACDPLSPQRHIAVLRMRDRRTSGAWLRNVGLWFGLGLGLGTAGLHAPRSRPGA